MGFLLLLRKMIKNTKEMFAQFLSLNSFSFPSSFLLKKEVMRYKMVSKFSKAFAAFN